MFTWTELAEVGSFWFKYIFKQLKGGIINPRFKQSVSGILWDVIRSGRLLLPILKSERSY